MLHLEIRQENDQRSGYSVDHNPNGPVDVVLLREDDDWDNIENREDIYYSLIEEQGKWKIRFGIDEGRGGNPGENISPKGVLFSEDDNILGIVIALFNAAPGQQFLSEFSREVSNGSTEPQLADRLAAHPVFTRDVIGGKSPAAQVTELMNHFGMATGSKDPDSAAYIAESFFTERIESEVGHGVIATEATFYLLSNDLLGNKILEKFFLTSSLFKLKISVADNYSVSNSSTDLATLQAVVAGITLQIGTDDSDNIEGSSFGGVISGGGGGDRITLESPQAARDVLALKNVLDSQINDNNGDGSITISGDGNSNSLSKISGDDNSNLSFDVVRNFSAGPADTDDRIDLSNFNFTGTQPGLVDASTRVSITTDLTSVPDLFSDEVAGDRGLAFLEYLIDDVSFFTTTYLFIDVNKDGDFTAADDMFLELVGVDDLIDANFIYYTGVSAIDPVGIPGDPVGVPGDPVGGPADPIGPVFSLTAAASVTEGDGLTYTITASDAVAADTDIVFTVVPDDTSAADQGTSSTNLNDFVAGAFNPVTVIIPAGQTTATFSVTAVNDGLTESVESYSVNAVVGGETLTTTTNLMDRQGAQTILTAAAASVTEGDGLTYTVTASEAVTADTVVEFTVVPSGAGADQGTSDTNANDFIVGSLNPTSVTILAGQTTATFFVSALSDGLTESVESYSVNAVVGGETLTTTTNLLDRQSTEDQIKLLKVYVGLFNAAPGTIFLPDLESFIGNGGTHQNLARELTATILFTDTLGGAATSAEQAAILAGNFGLIADNVAGSAATQVIDFFTAGIDAGTNIGDLVYDTVTFLSNSPPAEFAEIAQLLDNKAAVASSYSAAKGSSDLSVLQAAFAGVTGVAALTQAEIDALVAAAPDEPVVVPGDFTLTAANSATEGAAQTYTVTANEAVAADTITTNMTGNVARDSMKFVYKAGDSVSDSSTSGISTTLTDTIANLDGDTLSATAGASVEFDTEVQATAVTVGSTDVVLGTTTVANAGDFFVNIGFHNIDVNIDSAGVTHIDSSNVTHIYQDTDGDKIIEAGEFAVSLTGIQSDSLLAADFTVSGGDLMLMTT